MEVKFSFILSLIFCSTVYTQDLDVRFTSEPSKNSLGINENLRIDFKMNQDGDNFNAPNFEDFRVVGGPNQSVSNTWINGKRSFSKVYSFYLTPLKTGKLIIGQATIEINNQVYKTIPIEVDVTESVSISKNPNDPSYLVNENLHLVADISNISPYLNEGISITYKLFFSPQINVTNVGEIDSPKYNDFWSQNIKIPRLQIERGTYKGQSYNYVIWKKIVLYPQKAGKLNIQPLTLDVSVDVPTNKRDFFGNRIYSQVPKTVTAGKKDIMVSQLPNGAPESFSGAVGQFNIDLKTSKSELNASESVQATLKVSGNGNLKLFSVPELIVPNSIEKYDPQFKDNVKTNINGMYGNITNTYTLVPQFKGKYSISPAVFSYFDPKEKKYKNLNSSDITINVLEGPSSSFSGLVTNKNENSNNIVLSENQFKFLNTNSELSSIKKIDFIFSNLFYTLISIPFFLIFLTVLFSRNIKKSNDQSFKSRKANVLAKKHLSEAKLNLENKDIFYISLEKALINFFKLKFSIQSSELSKEKIKELLIENKIDKAMVELFLKLIESCEYARYTPSSTNAIKKDYDNSVQLISEIDKQIA